MDIKTFFNDELLPFIDNLHVKSKEENLYKMINTYNDYLNKKHALFRYVFHEEFDNYILENKNKIDKFIGLSFLYISIIQECNLIINNKTELIIKNPNFKKLEIECKNILIEINKKYSEEEFNEKFNY